MGKKISKETKKSTEAKKKPAVKELDITNFPELIFDNDKGCIVAEFEDGRDSVMIELNGAQFAAAVLKISNEISCCANKAQEESLRKRLEEKAKFCREKLKNSNRAYQYIRKDARQQNFEDALKQQLDDVINSLRKRKKEDSYHLGFRLGCLYGFLKSNKEIDSATELGKCLKDLQDFLEKNKIESHYSIEELGRELLYYHDKLLENKNLRLKWLNEFRKSDYFKENQNHTRVVSSVLSEARQKIKDKLEENGINISIEALLPMTTNRMKYPQEKIRFRGLNPFFEVAKGVLAIKGLQVIVSSEDWTEIKFIPKGIEELNIPEGVIRILGGVLGKCDKILGIKIPKSVSIIERGVFSRCSRLERIEVANENRAYKSKDGMLLNKEGTKLIFVLREKKELFKSLKVSLTLEIGHSAAV